MTTTEVVAAAEQTGIELDRKDLHMDEHIKELGTHHVFARLHTDVQFPITIGGEG